MLCFEIALFSHHGGASSLYFFSNGKSTLLFFSNFRGESVANRATDFLPVGKFISSLQL